MDCFWYTCGDDSAWSVWGRWVLVVCLVVCFLILLAIVYRLSSKRLDQGRPPIAGTGWIIHTGDRIVPHRGTNEDIDPVPPYVPTVGDHDAGYYDASGNFIAKGLPVYEEHPEAPTKAIVRTRSGAESDSGVELDYFTRSSPV